jgi:hypothetical protein
MNAEAPSTTCGSRSHLQSWLVPWWPGTQYQPTHLRAAIRFRNLIRHPRVRSTKSSSNSLSFAEAMPGHQGVIAASFKLGLTVRV